MAAFNCITAHHPACARFLSNDRPERLLHARLPSVFLAKSSWDSCELPLSLKKKECKVCHKLLGRCHADGVSALVCFCNRLSVRHVATCRFAQKVSVRKANR